LTDIKLSKKEGMEYIVGIEKVSKMDMLRYTFGKNDTYFKVYVGMPPMVPRIRKLLEEGFDVEGFGFRKFLTYESNILFVLRCMIDSDIPGANWIQLKKFQPIKEKTSHCQIEVEASVEDIVSLEPVGDWSKIAPLRILSFDIECAGKAGHFPKPEQDPVIMIANYVTLQ
jgi:DNA polymerase delta subunit 1